MYEYYTVIRVRIFILLFYYKKFFLRCQKDVIATFERRISENLNIIKRLLKEKKENLALFITFLILKIIFHRTWQLIKNKFFRNIREKFIYFQIKKKDLFQNF